MCFEFRAGCSSGPCLLWNLWLTPSFLAGCLCWRETGVWMLRGSGQVGGALGHFSPGDIGVMETRTPTRAGTRQPLKICALLPDLTLAHRPAQIFTPTQLSAWVCTLTRSHTVHKSPTLIFYPTFNTAQPTSCHTSHGN